MGEQLELTVHRVRFFQHTPLAIHCLAYSKASQRLALSRADGSVEIWSKADNWFQEKVIAVSVERSVEGLAWLGSRLFSVGLDSNVVEYHLASLQIKRQASSSAGAIWCVARNEADNQLAVGTEDGCVVLFDASDDNLEYSRAFNKLEGRILCIAWHVVESVIITGGPDNIRIWSAKSGHALQRILLGGKDTIVWCLAVTSDLTIISGDSRGKTSFWNGKQGTRIEQFQSHKADVLTLCVDEDETSVFSGGVDPVLAKYSFISPSANSGWKSWVRASSLSYHTHDVRASVMADNNVVTGGVDTTLICSQVSGGKKQKYVRLPAVPCHSMVSVAKEAKLLLLRYATYLELWRLGHTAAANAADGEILPLEVSELKLLQLKARQGERIVSSAISEDGSVIAYSDQEKLRVLRLTLKSLKSLTPSVSVARLPLKATRNLHAAQRLAISPDKSRLVAATCVGSLQVWDISGDQGSLLHTVSSHRSDGNSSFTNLCISDNGQVAASSVTGGGVHLYSLTKGQLLCALPTVAHQATALNFTTAGRALLVTYADHTVHEFDTTKEQYTAWSQNNSPHFPEQWLRQRGCLRAVMCRPDHPQKIFLHSEHSLLAINKTQVMPDRNYNLFNSQRGPSDTPRPLIACGKFKYLFHAEFLNADNLVVVEKTPAAIYDALEPALKKKKFGT